jgi:hypothetical protein
LVQFFEVENDTAVPQGAAVTVDPQDIVFFRPVETGVNDNGARAVIVAQTQPREVVVQLPATTIAVERTARTGAYAVVNTPLEVTGVVRQGNGLVIVTTAAPHLLVAGQHIILDDVLPGSEPAAITDGDATHTDASLNTIWSPTPGSAATMVMPGSPTQDAQALALADGRVFVAGGRNVAVITDARLFNISAQTTLADGSIRHTFAWTAAAAVPSGREFHRLSLLTDPSQGGNVLLGGGWDGTTVFSSTHIYNTTGDTWSASLPMATARAQHVAVVLLGGMVLAAGGGTTVTAATASAEVFLPSGLGGTWYSTGSMSTPRVNAQGFRLSDGRVVVCGGRPLGAGALLDVPDVTVAADVGALLATVEIFDPGTGTWSRTGDMNWARSWHVAVPLGDDQFLVVGGWGARPSQPSVRSWVAEAEVYDGRRGRWYRAGSMTTGRPTQTPQAVLLESRDQVVVFGGEGLLEPQLFNVLTRTWSSTTATLGAGDPFDGLASALSSEGVIISAGGSDGVGPTVEAFAYVPDSDIISMGGLNALHRLSGAGPVTPGLTASQFQFVTPDYAGFTNDVGDDTNLTVVAAEPSLPNIPGPYIFSPDDGPAITGIGTTTTAAVLANSQIQYLRVASTLGFPDAEGYIVLGLGFDNQLFPVKYLGVAEIDFGAGAEPVLVLDYGQVFPENIGAGATVILLVQKGPFIPVSPETLGSFYVTDSSAGRVAAQAALISIVAAGIALDINIIYTGDRGLGGEGLPTEGVNKLSDAVLVWAGNEPDAEAAAAREGI